MTSGRIFIFCFLLIHPFNIILGQFLDINTAKNITNSSGDDLFPKWSADGASIIFQSDRNKNWDIFLYSFKSDTCIPVISTDANEQHPVFYNNDESIVFDSDQDGNERIYKKDMSKENVSLLFERNIRAQQASFPSTGKLVYFSGYDELEKQWQIYSFEFYYENLNKLTGKAVKNLHPVVAPDEDHVLFVNSNNNYPFDHLHIMNWYGDEEQKLFEINITDPSWDNSGLKLYFISKKNSREGDLYSIWIDGSHFERLTKNAYEMRNPQVSPDGKYLAISVRIETGYDIFILPFEDY